MAEYATDEEILGISDDAPEVSSESPETSAPVETPSQETAEQPQLRPGSAKDETPAAKQQSDKTQQPAKPAKDGTAQQPQNIQEVNAAKAAELDRADEAFLSGDHGAMADVLSEMFSEKPEMALEAAWVNRAWLEQHAPEDRKST